MSTWKNKKDNSEDSVIDYCHNLTEPEQLTVPEQNPQRKSVVLAHRDPADVDPLLLRSNSLVQIYFSDTNGPQEVAVEQRLLQYGRVSVITNKVSLWTRARPGGTQTLGKILSCFARRVSRTFWLADCSRMATPTSTPRFLISNGRAAVSLTDRCLMGQKAGLWVRTWRLKVRVKWNSTDL